MSKEIFEKFTANNTEEELKSAANRLVFSTGNPLDVFSENGGAAAHVIRKRILNGPIPIAGSNVDSLVAKLLKHYHLENWKPPVPYFREALALTVQLKRVMTNIHPDFYGVLSELVEKSDGFETPNEVFALPYEKVEVLFKEVVKE